MNPFDQTIHRTGKNKVWGEEREKGQGEAERQRVKERQREAERDKERKNEREGERQRDIYTVREKNEGCKTAFTYFD